MGKYLARDLANCLDSQHEQMRDHSRALESRGAVS
jgi:hypothetical protein